MFYPAMLMKEITRSAGKLKPLTQVFITRPLNWPSAPRSSARGGRAWRGLGWGPGWQYRSRYPSPPIKSLGLPWNVVDSKGPKMREMRQMRLPWNVYENKRLNINYPGMLLMHRDLCQNSPTCLALLLERCGGAGGCRPMRARQGFRLLSPDATVASVYRKLKQVDTCYQERYIPYPVECCG
jgi:hypothetical protein